MGSVDLFFFTCIRRWNTSYYSTWGEEVGKGINMEGPDDYLKNIQILQ